MANKNYVCWQSEYDWKTGVTVVDLEEDSEMESDSSSNSRENTLWVLFEAGAQCQFSSVRIALCCKETIPEDVRKDWEIEMISHSVLSSLTNHVSAETRDKQGGSNACSLPTYNAVFVVDILTPYARTKSRQHLRPLGQSDNVSFHTLFELVQPLTMETQSVSVAFTSSQLFPLLIPRSEANLFEPTIEYSAGCRIMRIFPTVSSRPRRTIALPNDVLLVIFENIFDPTYPRWRRDLVSCALTCHRWTIALSGEFMFRDFRCGDLQTGYPPEISKFTAALAAQPSNCRFIKHLSAYYFERHLAWSQIPDDPSDGPQASGFSLFHLLDAHYSREDQCFRFFDAFASLVHLVKDVQTLCLDRKDPHHHLFSLIDMFPISMNLEALIINESGSEEDVITMGQVLSLIPKWPSIRRLTLFHIYEPYFEEEHAHMGPITFPLTELNLDNATITDDELMRLIGASASSLHQLAMEHIRALTTTGLATALCFVSKSLTCLFMLDHRFFLEEGEERALDTVISHLERLKDLEIDPEVASPLMLERRTRAFESSSEDGLPVVNLKLNVLERSKDTGIIEAAGLDWMGWKITVHRRKDGFGRDACRD